MEKVKNIISSFDYEEALYNPNYHFFSKKFKKIRSEFEYMIWFYDEGNLFQESSYPEKYLCFLQERGISIRSTSDLKNAKRWGDVLSHIDKEKIINSREKAFEIEKELFDTGGNIFNDFAKIPTGWLVKEDRGFSGRGLRVKKNKSGGPEGSFYAEPVHQRLLDIGHYVENASFATYINLIDDHFQYRGSIIVPSAFLKDHFFKKNWEKIERDRNQVANEYLKLGATNGFSIDSYFFIEKDAALYRPLVEVNYRRTMGHIAYQLQRIWSSPHHFCSLSLHKNRDPRDSFDWKKKNGFLDLSPPKRHFTLRFSSHNSFQELLQFLKGDLFYESFAKKLSFWVENF